MEIFSPFIKHKMFDISQVATQVQGIVAEVFLWPYWLTLFQKIVRDRKVNEPSGQSPNPSTPAVQRKNWGRDIYLADELVR